MDFDTKIWDEVFPEQDLETIATLYEHQAMVDGHRLEPPMLNQLRIQVYSDISHEQQPQVSIRMFPQSNNQQTFHCESGVPQF